MRKLASIQKIESLTPILNADNIELAKILDWYCVVKKGEFEEGDTGIYFEIDSILPKSDKRFEFMESTNYRVKTRKFCKQISQGLLMPLSDFPELKNKLGDDVSKKLGVTKKEDLDVPFRVKSEKVAILQKIVMSHTILRKLFSRFFVKQSGKFPSFIPKTDETRIQVIFNKLQPLFSETIWYVTKKMDGSSGTFYYNSGITGIASRNISIYKGKKYQFILEHFEKNNIYLQVNEKYGVCEKLAKYCKQNKRNMAIQGEICGPSIQKNRIGLTELTFYVFNIFDIDKNSYVNFKELKDITNELGLILVPVIYEEIKFNSDCDIAYFLNLVEEVKYKNNLAEGVVIRPIQEIVISGLGRVSFKVVNPNYLLKYDL